MQFILNDEQQMLRGSVRRFIDKTYSNGGRSRALASGFGFARDNWDFFAEMGWLIASLPEDVGGLGGGPFDNAIIAEELGRGLVLEPFVAVAVAATQTLLGLAPDDIDLLEGIGNGTLRPVLAHLERDGRGNREWLATTAVRDGSGFRLNGKKSAVVGAPIADFFLISARIEGQDGITLFEVAPDEPGLTLKNYRMFNNQGASILELEHVIVGEEAVVGKAGQALPVVERALDYALIIESAYALGAMQAALEITCEYLKTRQQFGVALATFQALQHKVADMFIEIEQSKSIVLRAVSALEGNDSAERTRATAAAKWFVGRAGKKVCGQAIQLHGGIGVTDECIVGHYFKHLTLFDLLQGPGSAHLERYLKVE